MISSTPSTNKKQMWSSWPYIDSAAGRNLHGSTLCFCLCLEKVSSKYSKWTCKGTKLTYGVSHQCSTTHVWHHQTDKMQDSWWAKMNFFGTRVVTTNNGDWNSMLKWTNYRLVHAYAIGMVYIWCRSINQALVSHLESPFCDSGCWCG